ncbi:MAG: alpha/beta hydrolase [Planctomycetota bacterium]
MSIGRYQRVSFRHRFSGGQGHTLAAIIDRPSPDQLPVPPVLVFSHCFTCNKDLKAITRISRRMAELGIAVFRFDMTGLGGSEGDFSQTNFSTNLADIGAAVHAASEEIGPVTSLMGMSFGGAASLGFASGMLSSDSARIQSVMTLAAPSDTQHLAALLVRMNPAIESSGKGEVVIGGRSWLIRKQMIDDFRSHALADQLPELSVPVLVMHSPVDETVSYDHALRIASLVGTRGAAGTQGAAGTRCSILTLNGADHLLTRDMADIEWIAASAAAFIQRHAH